MKAKQLTVMIKPASGLCQMACKYCFYHNLISCGGAPAGRMMQDSTVTALLAEIKRNLMPDGQVTFAFQGGEPLLIGPDFYRNFFDLAEQLGISAFYAFQTNGLCIADPDQGNEWIALFRKYHCLIGLSVDGPRNLHDTNRRTNVGTDTHDAVMLAYRRLRKAGVDVNFLTVLSPEVTAHPEDLFNFYKASGISYVQLIPCLPPLQTEGTRLSGDFLITFYRLWKKDFQNGRPSFEVREFTAILNALNGYRSDPCIFSGKCTPQLVVEADGSLYPCDFYVLPEYRTGMIGTDSLDSTLLSDGMKAFLRDYPPLPGPCRECPFVQICGGGCRRMRDAWRPDLPDCPMRQLLNYIVRNP